MFRDQIVLLNTKTNLNLHYSQDKEIPIDILPQVPKEHNRPIDPDYRQDPG